MQRNRKKAKTPINKAFSTRKQPFLSKWGPVIILLFYLTLLTILRLKLPETKAIIEIVTTFYTTYGYPTVFLSGLIEGIFLIGFYFPGSAAILLGAVVARTGAVFLPFIMLVGTLGLLTAYCINYFLGKHGWSHILSRFGFADTLTRTEKKLTEHGTKALFFGYISPSSGALLSTAAGTLKMPFKRFFLLSLISQSFWSIMWGSIAYALGSVFVEVFLNYLVYIVMGIVAFIFLKEFWKQWKEKATP